MKMQVSFSDERRKVSGSRLSVLQGKGSLEKTDWCFVSGNREVEDFQTVYFCDSADFLLNTVRQSSLLPRLLSFISC